MPKLISRKIGEAGYSSFHTVCNKPVLQREKEINQKLLLNFRQINFQSSFHGIFVAKLSEVSSQCGNYANLLLLFYGKNKATYLLNNSLKRWFHENFWLRVNFSFFHTVSFMFCKYLHFGHEIRQMQFFFLKKSWHAKDFWMIWFVGKIIPILRFPLPHLPSRYQSTVWKCQWFTLTRFLSKIPWNQHNYKM